MSTIFVTNAQAKSTGFGSVSTPTSAGTYVQLPNIVCDEVLFGVNTNAINLAASSSPGNNVITLNVAAGNSPSTWIPCAGNANNLWIANATAITADAVGFVWRKFNNPIR